MQLLKNVLYDVLLTCIKFHIGTKDLAVGRWFPPGTPVSSTRKLISSSSFHRLDMTLAVAEALNPNTLPNKRSRNFKDTIRLNLSNYCFRYFKLITAITEIRLT